MLVARRPPASALSALAPVTAKFTSFGCAGVDFTAMAFDQIHSRSAPVWRCDSFFISDTLSASFIREAATFRRDVLSGSSHLEPLCDAA